MTAVSQSVARAFRIFEIFQGEKRALQAQELAERLDAPRSSAAALLKSLVELEMLSLDRRTSTYFPTARFSALSSWLSNTSLYPPHLLETLRWLRDETGETVTLAAYHDLHMELAQVESSGQGISFRAEKGQTFSIWSTGVGTAYLATLDNQQIRNLYRRSEDRKLIHSANLAIRTVLEDAEFCRAHGYFIAEGRVFPDATAISAPTGLSVAGRALIVSITGPTQRMKPQFGHLAAMLVGRVHGRNQND